MYAAEPARLTPDKPAIVMATTGDVVTFAEYEAGANRVLEYMEYDVAELAPALARDCERAVREGRLSVAESQALKRFYENELNGYAYLEP